MLPVPTIIVAPLFVVTPSVVPAKILPPMVRVLPWVRVTAPAVAIKVPTFKVPRLVFREIVPVVALTPATLILFTPEVSRTNLSV